MRRLAVWAVMVFVFSVPWQNAVTFPGIGTLSSVLGAAAFAVGAGVSLLSGRLRRIPVFLVVFGALTAWCAASYFWSAAPDLTVRRVQTLVQLLAMAWLVWQVCGDEDVVPGLMLAYLAGAYVVIAATSLTFVSQLASGADRFSPQGFNPNGVAIIVALGIPMAWFVLGGELRAPLRPGVLAYPFAALATVVLTASRGGLVTAVVACAVIVLARGPWRGAHRPGLIAATSAALLAGAALLPTLAQALSRSVERLSGTTDALRTGDLNHRQEIWSAGFSLLSGRPLTGVGAGAFPEAIRGILGYSTVPHNAFISILVDTGLIGLGLFGLALLVAALPLARLPREEALTLGVLFAALIVSLLPANQEIHKATWLVLALIVSRAPLLLGGRPALRPASQEVRHGPVT